MPICHAIGVTRTDCSMWLHCCSKHWWSGMSTIGCPVDDLSSNNSRTFHQTACHTHTRHTQQKDLTVACGQSMPTLPQTAPAAQHMQQSVVCLNMQQHAQCVCGCSYRCCTACKQRSIAAAGKRAVQEGKLQTCWRLLRLRAVSGSSSPRASRSATASVLRPTLAAVG